MKGQTGNRSSWVWWLTVLIVLAAAPVYALGIGVNRSPVPPDCVLNDGTGVEQYDWEIQFDSTPDHYIEVLLDPDGEIIYCIFHDLIGWTTTLPAAWQSCSYSDESAGWPQASPVADFNSWLAPATAQLGRYEIRIQYFSVEVGEMWEAEGAVTFYVCQATGSLSMTKWHDLNANGVRDHGEPGIPFWKLSFTDPFGSTFNRLTDSNGNVEEDSLPIGHYSTWETVKPGWTNSTPVALTVGVLTGKETEVTFGNYETGSIGDYVWLDANRDGVQDNDEAGIPDVSLELWIDSNGDGDYDTLVSTEATDENGWYLFDELPPGKYLVNVVESTLPAGAHVLTTDNEPFPYELAPEEDMLDADFGYFKCDVEKCNGIDDDCDDETDEDFPVDEACDGDDGDECKNGTWSCGDDGWSVECLNETVTDITETCNALDDDCDGDIDEDYPVGEACDGADDDQCETGTLTCRADRSGVECVNESEPNIEEVCDGQDNDCDGETDEDFTLLGEACDSADSDMCANGHFECHGPSICRDPNGCNEPIYECINDFPMDIVEICDGIDNDCDGSIDEGLGTSTCGVGACFVTTDNCIGGQPQTCEPGSPTDETCDLVDNDCDGAVDEDLGTTSCGTGLCVASVEFCVDGQVQNCEPGTPAAEVCDLADNDCDGAVDEDLGTTTCGVGSCEITVDNCVDGEVQSCVPGDPHAETCDLMDNDCDGSVDEDLGITSCGVGACSASTENCINGEERTCVPGDAGNEICDFIDNDCDGAVDEDLGTTTCGVGACEITVDNCDDGEVQTCNPNPPGAEICDFIDNDCDGAVDEDLGTTTCGVGACEITVDNCDDGEIQTCNPNPPGTEVCDLIDNDCDGSVDEDLGTTSCGVGGCEATVDNCVNGEVQSCAPGAPVDETCDLVDNDCDGAVDEDLGTSTCGVGACVATVDNCVGGEVQTCAPGAPVDEACDLVDNDCDGAVDEDLGTTTCGLGACEATVANCVAGEVLSCEPGAPAAEVCDLVDNDCDGSVDEDLGTTTCGSGACEATVDNCVNGEVQSCVAGDPIDEICDLLDNDCDGAVDEDLGTTTCGEGGCQATVENCIDGELQNCVPGDSVAESCDGVDNNCDGEVDNFLGTTTCGIGSCEVTVENCVGGEEQSCVPLDAADEFCDLIDNDCDGEIDEDLGSTTCGVGECEVTVDNCGSGTTDLEAFAAGLPAQVSKIISHPGASFGAPSYYDVTILGDSILAGMFDAYCVDTDTYITPGTTYLADVYSSYGAIPDGIIEFPENLDLVNYILNSGYVGTPSQDGSAFTFGDVQRAIWTLIDDGLVGNGLGPWSQARVDEILDDALADGEGFEPDCDGYVGVILDPVGANQLTIAQVTLALIPGACDPNQECVPGEPAEEICDGLDNDCDGEIDEDLGTTSCGVGACATTVDNCVAGQVQTCVPGAPVAESCDLIDNDCDGSIDEDLGSTTCGQGECVNSVENCVNGQTQVCDPLLGATDETCDELDNDCDGSTDEGFGLGDSCSIDPCGYGAAMSATLQPCVQTGEYVCDADGTATCQSSGCTMQTVWQLGTFDYDVNPIVGGSEYPNNDAWSAQFDYTVTAVVDLAPDMPGYLSNVAMSEIDPNRPLIDGTAQLNIHFELAGDLDNGVLHFSRYGSETNLLFVDLDGDPLATTMVAEGVNEVYELPMPALVSGWHVVSLVYVGDGANNGNYIDALRLAGESCGDLGPELCGNGLDDNCNCEIDEGFEDLGEACEDGIGACYNDGEMVCTDDGLDTECSVEAGAPSDEVCDLLDNDCDGATDEDLGSSTCGQGQCVNTVANCVNGQVQSCDPYSGADDETCDLVDNDCDGVIDNDLGTTTCGVGECENTVDNCGDGGADLDAFAAGLPAQVSKIIAHPGTGFGAPSYYDVTIVGQSILAGVFDAYCVDTDTYITPGTTYLADVYSSYDAIPDGIMEYPENLDLVNYILNMGYVGTPSQDGSLFTYGDVQRAIWTLIDDGLLTNGLGAWSQARVDEILADATADGDGYVPDCDGYVGVILDPVTNNQLTIAQVTMALVSGTCDPNQQCVPGDPTEEICDGLDNDCDGEIDEDLGSTSCGLGACAATVDNCVAGQVQACVPGVPVAESCDLVDNDCDGSVDEDLGTSTCGVGECENTVDNCVAGQAQTCVPGDAVTELCDALDNDCDGSIDEGFNLGDSCSTGGCGGENLEIWAVSDENDPLIIATDNAVLTGSTMACNFEHNYDGMEEYKAFFVDTVLAINDDFAPDLLYAYGAYDGSDWTGMDDTLEEMVADGDVGSYDMWDVSAGTPLDILPGDLDGIDVVILDAAPDTAANHFVVTEGSKQVLRDFQDNGGKLIVSAYIFVYWHDYVNSGYAMQNTDLADLVGNVLPDITQAAWPTATTLEPSPHGAGETLVTLIGAEPWRKKAKDPFFHEFWVLDASPVVSACYAEGEYVCAADGTAECNAEVIQPGDELCGDGIDNDCDCVADEGFDNVGNSCDVGVGACYAEGEIVCSADGLSEACDAVAGDPVDETCDGLDNDCDGSVDEVLGTTTCGVGTCQVTVDNCVNGVPQQCQAKAPTDEVCDGIDNDCDGLVDEDLGTTTCGVGACQASVEYCVNGEIQSCTPGAPSSEVCDLVDNDCDGSIDEDLGVTTCGQGICQVTVENCVAGEAQNCAPATPSCEVCDGLDNDCDGLVDEGLGTTTCGVGACKTTVQNCVNGSWQVCSAGTPGTEVCDGIDNDCDSATDEGLGSLTCGEGACENTVQACVNGQAQQCTPGTPGVEICDDVTDNDCDGSIDEGCDSNDDCELPDECVTLAEAFARDWIAIDTPSSQSSTVTIHNLGPVEVCLDEHLLFISDPTQSMTNGTEKANGKKMKIAAGGKMNLRYAPWTYPNGYYQPYLNQAPWWCVEYGQLSTKNTLFGYYGEQAPEMVQYYLDNKTDTDNDGKEDHVDWGGKYGTKTLYNVWGYQNSHGVLTAGKVAGAAGPGTIAVVLTSHNMGAFSAQGVLVDTLPAGYWVENFSLDPDGWVENNDGTVTMYWNIDLEGYEDKSGWNTTTVFDVIEISYDLHADWDEDGKRIELPRASITFCDGQGERTSNSALVVAINVDVDGDGFGGCQDCDNGDEDVYPGADEICDGADNDCDGDIDEGCPVCGNGIIEDGEICDDGDDNENVMYACQTDCTLSIMWPTSGQTTIAYEDLPQYGGNDWDYNDWVIELEVEYIFNADGVKQMRFYADPWARGAAYHHSQGIAVAMGTYSSTGTYQVKHYNTAWEKTGEEAEVTFGTDEDIAITMFADTWETLPPNSVNGDTGVWSFDANTEIGYGTVLGPKVGVEFHFDTALPMEPALLLNTSPGTHCENMPYDLYLLVNNTGEYIANGDTRMLCVPDYWDWPSEKQSIWDVYEGITPAAGGPVFDEGWYLADPVGSTWYAGQ